MKFLTFLLTIGLVLSSMIIVHGDKYKQHSTNLFRDRLLNLLLEAKQRNLFQDQYIEPEDASPKVDNRQSNDRNDQGRTYVRRKIVGISDNPR